MDKELISQFRTDLGRCIQIELDYAHVDCEKLADFGLDYSRTIIRKQEAFELFNNVCLMNGVPTLQDPGGYMHMDNNLYDFIKETYIDVYDKRAVAIETGMSVGTVYAVDGVLNKLDKEVRDNFTKIKVMNVKGEPHKRDEDVMPANLNYRDMKFIEPTDELKNIVRTIVEARVAITLANSERRKYEQTTLDRYQTIFDETRRDFRKALRPYVETRNGELEAAMGAELSEALGGLDYDNTYYIK